MAGEESVCLGVCLTYRYICIYIYIRKGQQQTERLMVSIKSDFASQCSVTVCRDVEILDDTRTDRNVIQEWWGINKTKRPILGIVSSQAVTVLYLYASTKSNRIPAVPQQSQVRGREH